MVRSESEKCNVQISIENIAGGGKRAGWNLDYLETVIRQTA